MKKLNKILTVFMLVIMLFAFVSPVFASGDIKQNFNFSSSTTATDLQTKLGNVWGIISMAANFIAVVMVVIAGIRYMFASADQKADIKKQTIILIIGAVFIFAAGRIVSLISSTATSVL